MTKHQKHPKMVRTAMGTWGRNEWAIHGTDCSTIQALAKEIIKVLGKQLKIAYVDTDHQSFKETLSTEYIEESAYLSYSDKQSYQQIETNISNPDFSNKFNFNDADLILLNGNHHTGKKQLVFLDENKVKSLEKRKDRLTDIQAFIPLNSYNVVPTYINEQNNPKFIEKVDLKSITKLIWEDYQKNRLAPVKALVLAGGKSERMGEDKGELIYHSKIQREHVAEMLKNQVNEVFMSVRPEQADTIKSNFPLLVDRIEGMGPYGAIVSAFLHDPNAAWLVVACDLPMLNDATLEQLIQERDPKFLATCFKSPVNEFPEPLITIWEPKSYMRIMQFMSIGYSCPRKVLINSDCKILEVKDPNTLMNVNKPEEHELAKQMIHGKQ